ncbi:aldose epimerase [Streptococcus pseudopneumoniae]|nr:aldose epimerase [Streptococcus pseudopneumoniae]TMR74675.1 aldose epimerase [Streptococcus pseudopneumoniae]
MPCYDALTENHLEDKKNVRLLEANQVEELGFEIEVL